MQRHAGPGGAALFVAVALLLLGAGTVGCAGPRTSGEAPGPRSDLGAAPLSAGDLGHAAPDRSAELTRLADWLTGSFSSAAQAAADSAYFDIRLEMVRVWPERTDGIWIYVEQAAAWTLSEPYRQRVYRLEDHSPGRYRSTVYELPDPAAVVGAFREAAPLSALAPNSLVLRAGCHILLRLEGDRFVGGTEGRSCESSLRGAAYATSEVVVAASGLESWDRGWNDAGEQVWGAVEGGYRFDKVRDE